MLRFAHHSNKPLARAYNLSTRCQDKPCHGLKLAPPSSGGGLGHRPPRQTLRDRYDKGSLPGLAARVSTSKGIC
jgi:hypothetical protein